MVSSTIAHRQDGLVDPHILVVEDDLRLRELFVLVARLQGFSADSAANGEEGLRKLRARRPSLVVLNLTMPVLSGWEFREQQLQDPAIADVPVLCLSDVADLRSHGLQLRTHCMPKPVDPERLAVALRDICEGDHSDQRQCWCSMSTSEALLSACA